MSKNTREAIKKIREAAKKEYVYTMDDICFETLLLPKEIYHIFNYHENLKDDVETILRRRRIREIPRREKQLRTNDQIATDNILIEEVAATSLTTLGISQKLGITQNTIMTNFRLDPEFKKKIQQILNDNLEMIKKYRTTNSI